VPLGVVALLTLSTAFAKEKTVDVAEQPPLRGVAALTVEQRRAFLRGLLADWRTDTDFSRGLPPPPIQKSCPANAVRIPLVNPQDLKINTAKVKQAVDRRRSRRSFSTESLSLEEFSYLLWATQGISKIDRDSNNRIFAHYRTVPSGGGRHPFETYLAVTRVTGVKPGLYRYLAVEHQLLELKRDAHISTHLKEVCYAQDFVADAAVNFIWCAVPYRTEWKYGAIAQKMVAIEAGHLCQNLYLAAESVRIGVCASLGYNQAMLDRLLGVDGKEEFAIYMAAVGKPEKED
jgi:SagB-type dehydrogenase family enzyme